MRIYERYLGRQVYLAFIFILFAFSGLFFFFDLINELGTVGRGGYSFGYAVVRVLLQTPSHFYEIIPVAALISAIYVFAQMASSSEWTILRVSGLSPQRALGTLMKIGVPLMVLTLLLGELVGPYADQLSERVRLRALGTPASSDFQSGIWLKDSLSNDGSGHRVTRFVNVGSLEADTSIRNVKVYEFDDQLHLTTVRLAERGTFVAPDNWRLEKVSESTIDEHGPANASWNTLSTTTSATTRALPVYMMRSELTPRILSVLLVSPNRMSLYALTSYISHLRENNQDTQRYEIALWRKLLYPFAVLVMMTLSLPFAYLHARSGVVGVKVFGGIMLGMSFQLVNTLFSHVGNLNTWPAPITAATPSLLYLLLAIAGLRWADRH
ncbi:LPS export ABC transporter permease LptG [Chitinasiproducens palmae]|uniref:Lipopolysaccharide export system permease protein n=1 Tax=Chitinasiproducens palmae TaxID=1770053 RepID=A0A1H2PMY6_9BURK|nr:LPS export ABC transporter permease LptG [Chitinasiproducens palmae]SDV48017.1 lipopolysaccharide export system permease protein [Chitinasiproducens palmae]